MSRPFTIRINVSRVLKQYLYDGKNGKYLNLAVFEKKEPDQYGNTHFVTQDIPKEARDAGEKGPILGDAKIESGGQSSQSSPDRNFSRPPERKTRAIEEDDEIPF